MCLGISGVCLSCCTASRRKAPKLWLTGLESRSLPCLPLYSCLCAGWRHAWCRSWHVGKVVFVGLVFQECLGLGKVLGASKCDLGGVGTPVGQQGALA